MNAGYGLTPTARLALLRRLDARPDARPDPAPATTTTGPGRDLATLPGAGELARLRAAAAAFGFANPYGRTHDGVAGGRTSIDGRGHLNFASYNYLGLNGDPRIAAAAKAAIDRYGVSASASRIVSGERPIHAELEAALAAWHGVEAAVVMVSGHATAVTTLGQLFGPRDLILHDQLIHNCVLEGARLAGAKRLAFAHNDWAAAAAALAAHRADHRRALIAIEGHYSMDGDVPELARFVGVAQAHDALLLVDEAHATGVVGATGRGIAEHAGVDPAAVDIWFGTLSKTLASAGGYIAGSARLVDLLRHTAPGFVYSVGLAPPLAAAALAALGVLAAEPWRVARLQANARHFVAGLRAAEFDTGRSAGFGIVPVITGDSARAIRLAAALFAHGINAPPILAPAVPEDAARLRFFLSTEHTPAELDATVAALVAARG